MAKPQQYDSAQEIFVTPAKAPSISPDDLPDVVNFFRALIKADLDFKNGKAEETDRKPEG